MSAVLEDAVGRGSDAVKVGNSGLTVLFDPTALCNLDCIYCYKGAKQPRSISTSDACRVLSQVMDYNDRHHANTLVVWHGGEPTLMGTSFFRAVFEFTEQAQTTVPVRHTVQTNGTLLDDDLLDLFAQHKVSISASVDGPPEYHDRIRRSLSGTPSHAKAIEGLLRAQKWGVDVGVLMSIGTSNARYVRGMFQFCKEHSFSLGLNPITADFHSDHHGTEVSAEVYLDACLDAFDLWFYQDSPIIQVNPGYGVVALLLSRARLSDCFLSENCQQHFISVGPEGDVYPCNRFYGLDAYRFGNLLREDIDSVLASPVRAGILSRDANRIGQCSRCEIRAFCNGGCMHHALVHGGSLQKPDHLCVVYRGLVKHALMRLDSVLPVVGQDELNRKDERQ